MVALRSMRKLSGLVAARIRTMTIAITSMTAMMATIVSMTGSVNLNAWRGKSAAEGYQRAQAAVTQPEPAPHHQTEIEAEQREREQRTVDPQMGCDRAAEIAGEQDRTQDRGRRHRIKQC